MKEDLIVRNTKDIPEIDSSDSLVDYSECLADWYIEKTVPEYRKKRGQFFTPRVVSEFMVRQFEDITNKKEIRILDPGAGLGIFESTFCEHILSLGHKTKVTFVLYENDTNLLLLLRKNMRTCKKIMADEGFKISYSIITNDFILSNASIFTGKRKKIDSAKKGFDLVICNPPYCKINKTSPQAIQMQDILNGQPNIYSLFMVLSATLLRNDGQMTVLTPRSYCSGAYFRKFRKWFFNIVKPFKIHIFESRKKIFSKYNVLQENVILTAIKTSRTPKKIAISTSNGAVNKDKELRSRSTTYDKIIVKKGDDIIMRIPTSELDEVVTRELDKFSNTLESLGFKVSTGPVVPFRTKEFIMKKVEDNKECVPLIWMHNIINGSIKWPIEKNNKPVAIGKSKKSEGVLIPNRNYVLVKRFSSKEGKQRINAGIHLKTLFNSDVVGIENHVNYIYKKDA